MTKQQDAERVKIIAHLVDHFEASGAEYTSAASVVHEVRATARALCRNTIHDPETLSLRAADKVHERHGSR